MTIIFNPMMVNIIMMDTDVDGDHDHMTIIVLVNIS